VIAELGTLEKNKDIDKRVEELRQLRKDSEVKRANAEKILNQVETFKKAKNNKLSERINSHFKVAQFRLFRTLKNGSVEDACDVIVDGKEINSQANQSLQVLAKLDIIRGLSDYFETWLPVFADDYALITSGTDNRVVMKNQLIKLIATEGVKELEVKGE
jgi:dsDNA-specific endonuclease/ATPase MutS2